MLSCAQAHLVCPRPTSNEGGKHKADTRRALGAVTKRQCMRGEQRRERNEQTRCCKRRQARHTDTGTTTAAAIIGFWTFSSGCNGETVKVNHAGILSQLLAYSLSHVFALNHSTDRSSTPSAFATNRSSQYSQHAGARSVQGGACEAQTLVSSAG